MPTAIRNRVARSLTSATVACVVTLSTTALAADKVTFLTSWYAQAEHGGFYQAKATGLYEKAGLDVTIKMGGPQVNGMQLMMAGQADMHMGYDFQVLKSLETSGIASAVSGRIFAGRASGSYSYRPSKMCAVTMRE